MNRTGQPATLENLSENALALAIARTDLPEDDFRDMLDLPYMLRTRTAYDTLLWVEYRKASADIQTAVMMSWPMPTA